MTAAEIAAWVGGGTGLSGLAATAALLMRARPESKKLKAEAAKIVGDTYAALVGSVNAQLDRMTTRVVEVEKKLDELEEREDRQERLLLVHERWDLAAIDQIRQGGGHVGDPPPLYPDSTAV